MPPSFELLNYALRSNKAVERKLIIEALRRLSARFPVPDYVYVGLGSLWFVDFLLMHKTFETRRMFSIERDDGEERARFNCPLSCIKVEPGESTDVLPNLFQWADSRAAVWLDYDGPLTPGVLEDLRILVERALSGSAIFVTLNAHKGNLGAEDPEGVLREIAGPLVPNPLPPHALTSGGYPKLLASIIFDQLDHIAIACGRGMQVFRVLNTVYKDGAPMVTIGAVLCNEQDRELVAACELRRPAFLNPATQYEIEVPPLTTKEKMTLDRLLPTGAPLTAEAIGFPLRPSQIASYVDLYRYYPVFGELI